MVEKVDGFDGQLFVASFASLNRWDFETVRKKKRTNKKQLNEDGSSIPAEFSDGFRFPPIFFQIIIYIDKGGAGGLEKWPIESQVVMVYTLIDSTSETGGTAVNCEDPSLVFFLFSRGVSWLWKFSIYFNLGWSDAFNFYKWFFVIYTSLQWIALVAWSLAVEKQAETRMKHQWHKFFAHGFMWDMFQNWS